MSTPTPSSADQVHEALSKELLRLAQNEEEMATRQAARVRYWEAMPVTVIVHRRCARALREAAEELGSPP